MKEPEILDSRQFDARELAEAWPPRFSDSNKRAVFRKLMAGPTPSALVHWSRWSPAALPDWTGPRSRVEAVPGFFRYTDDSTGSVVHWHLNFAMSSVFGAYAGPLAAQDELQVLEHPALASARHAVQAAGGSTMCVDHDAGIATPILVSGVERRGVVDTFPTPTRPLGLYGNAFSSAREAEVLVATTRLDPPTASNIIAIEAPAYGRGEYAEQEITFILQTAVSGFRAAVLEPRLVRGRTGHGTAIHTGFWGCGAYGGNQEIMSVLQLVAADMAGVDQLKFHTATGTGPEQFELGRRRYSTLEPGPASSIVSQVASWRLRWGVSNGT